MHRVEVRHPVDEHLRLRQRDCIVERGADSTHTPAVNSTLSAKFKMLSYTF